MCLNEPEPDELSNYASIAPYVCSLIVLLISKNDFRSSVEPRTDIIGQLPSGLILTFFVVVGSGPAKVTKSDLAVLVDKYVAWLDVPVHDPSKVEKPQRNEKVVSHNHNLVELELCLLVYDSE